MKCCRWLALGACTAIISFNATAQVGQADQLGVQVSRTIAPWLDALERCGELEYKDIETCAGNTSPLVEDRDVASRAKHAMQLRSELFSLCRKSNKQQYCDDLFVRAITLELKRKAGMIKKR